ncbi:cytochrome c biogenesis CcdA family protein [Bacillus sp. V59.32b]|uniref:cytochrome c biogenesis CcdA family protein n=1 Tax=Bacillus sp. V59.32b TaxID=1758642 RepID=UPI000E3C945D|nr:cytochrome c biogenesis protein CcdA [Bacillus sp. V59.32b]RFU69592.1 cytochrome c biogenesis protein CcdA [Bacillus sp. V59.32b]
MEELNIALAFFAGLLSFLSPCSLPLYPAFLSYITGISLNDLKKERSIFKRTAMLHTLLFLLGFSIIFMALGWSSSLVGTFFIENKELLRQLGAIIIFFFGLIMTGLIKVDFLLGEKKFQFKNRPAGYFGSILIGMGFAAGWTPCTGPILAGVIALSISNPGQGLIYMSFYCLGFAVPFVIMSLFIDKLTFIKRHTQIMMKIGGFIMLFMGIFLYFNWLTKIISFLTNNFFGGFTGF